MRALVNFKIVPVRPHPFPLPLPYGLILAHHRSVRLRFLDSTLAPSALLSFHSFFARSLCPPLVWCAFFRHHKHLPAASALEQHHLSELFPTEGCLSLKFSASVVFFRSSQFFTACQTRGADFTRKRAKERTRPRANEIGTSYAVSNQQLHSHIALLSPRNLTLMSNPHRKFQSIFAKSTFFGKQNRILSFFSQDRHRVLPITTCNSFAILSVYEQFQN